MSFKAKLELRKLNKALSTNSWKGYLSLLRNVIRTNDLPPEASQILSLFESGNIEKGYMIADALSKQKYLDATQHFVAHQFASLVRKYPFEGRNPFDPSKEAWSKFTLAEMQCETTNQAMSKSLGSFESSLWKMRHFVRHALGDTPPLVRIYENCDFGPGASIGVHGNATHLMAKLSAIRWSVTPSAYNIASAAISHNHQICRYLLSRDDGFYEWSASNFETKFRERVELCDYNKISFVPKTAKTLRSIAVEPLLNTFVQKGIDQVMRQNLKRLGIDLSDQSINSEFARLGSLNWRDDDTFCTIDLESASDSISIELVRHLLPPEWFDLLDRTRSPAYLHDEHKVRYNKFCSMGNGFCFPLETLIFASIVHSCGGGIPGRDYLVYGDDIVVRKSIFDEVVSTLLAFGFKVNPAKTFSEGPFRESCGRDWFGGKDVRPFILDFPLDSLENLIKFYNLTLRNSNTSLFFRECRQLIYDSIPAQLRFTRPTIGSAFGAMQVELDVFMSSPFAKWNSACQCWSWLEMSVIPVSDMRRNDNSQDDILMTAALRGSTSSQPFTYRRKTITKIRRVLHS